MKPLPVPSGERLGKREKESVERERREERERHKERERETKRERDRLCIAAGLDENVCPYKSICLCTVCTCINIKIVCTIACYC